MSATIRRGPYRKPMVVEDENDYLDETPAYAPWWRAFPEGTYTTLGLHNMLQPAVEDMNAAMRKASGSRYCHLPYNFSGLLGIPAMPTRNIITVSPKKKQVERTARMAGWLTAAAKMPGMVKILQRITTGKGINSPRHQWDPIQMVESLRSPGRANRVFWKVRAIANDLLRPYGLQVTWHEVARSICKSPRRHNKAARAAAAATIAGHVWHICQESIWNRRQPMRPWQVLRAAIGLTELTTVSRVIANWAVTNVAEGNFATIREALSNQERLRPITFHQYMIGTLVGVIDDNSCVVDGNLTARRFYVTSDDKQVWVSHGWQIQSNRKTHNAWRCSYQSAVKEAVDNWGQKISA